MKVIECWKVAASMLREPNLGGWINHRSFGFFGGNMLALLLVASWCNLSLDQPLLKTWLTWPSTLIFQKLKPHIFTVGEQTYRNVKSLIEPINQSIVVSGESGAGKVEVPVSYPVPYTWPGERKGEDHCLCHQWLPSHSQTGRLN